MPNSAFRAAAILNAKPNCERELLDLTREVIPTLRKVEGLERVEVSRSVNDPAQILLYYWWDSPDASSRYMQGSVYAALRPRLAQLIQSHVLVVSELMDA